MLQNEIIINKQLELNNAMQVKEQFLNIVAHDIKNNLTSISLISSMLTNYWDKLKEDEKIKKLNDINKSTHLLDEFLKELLLWSKTHSSNISFSPKKQDIIPVINNLLAIFKLNPENAKKTCDFNPNQEVIFEFDLNILSTVIRNLITNSIKFTDSNGLISIRFEQTFSDISIIVEDNGIGMTPNELDILMDLTKSKKKINNSKNKGTGLGVNLCIELVKIHSGTIKIESEQDKGTKTIITLPKYY